MIGPKRAIRPVDGVSNTLVSFKLGVIFTETVFGKLA